MSELFLVCVEVGLALRVEASEKLLSLLPRKEVAQDRHHAHLAVQLVKHADSLHA